LTVLLTTVCRPQSPLSSIHSDVQSFPSPSHAGAQHSWWWSRLGDNTRGQAIGRDESRRTI